MNFNEDKIKFAVSPHTVTLTVIIPGSGLCRLESVGSLGQDFLGGGWGLADLALSLPLLVPMQNLVDAVLRFLSGVRQAEIHVSDGSVVLHSLLNLLSTLLKCG